MVRVAGAMAEESSQESGEATVRMVKSFRRQRARTNLQLYIHLLAQNYKTNIRGAKKYSWRLSYE